ncbi:replication protein A 70 kDa DNA-binding subunit A-like [Cynara cardunculus var. scolymus]|uniref:Replication protein A subunit n=1 Tax=Cynara cardunculus var. scolymus TaxID=59895 RepID=A0A124SBQ0_CYNCS|nr:replication protein A 70 kDa DNA-binding subunit A-like [Cynara cardunculus var. scolymus]KVH91342.1 Nucleic acid-binding, OB-fold [Cynara cardunculus var. scolymus]
MAVNLTTGAISILSSGECQATDVKPVVQVRDIRVQTQTSAGGGGGENKEKYRVLLSDGLFHQQGMLATQCNELVRSQQLQKGSIVQLTEFACNTIRERIIIIIIDLNVILDKCDLIGDPKPFPLKPSGSEASSMARSAAPLPSSLNQTASTLTDVQYSTEGSLAGSAPRPNFNVGTPVHIPEHQHSAGLHSYGSSFCSNSASGQYNSMQHASANKRTNPIQLVYNQPPPVYGNRGPMAKNEAPPRVIPIAALNPYQGRWTIKARVTVKGELRRYNNAKGDGKVFSFDLVDSDCGEIRATCFNAVADQFYNQIEVGKVYYISKGSLKPAQKAFNHLNNDHEIMLDNTSMVQPCFDDDNLIPHQQFHFRSIGEIEGMDNNSVLDIIGVVSGITPSCSIMRKNGTETHKRTLHLKDMSGRSIELTLWGNFCDVEGQTLQTMSDSGAFPVLAVKSARVNDFNGKSLGTISISQLCIEPDFPEACKLKAWFDSVGRNAPSVSMSRDTVARTDVLKTISQIKDEKLGTSEKPDWITVNATIFYMNVDNFCYTACPIMLGDRKCSKKVVNNGDGKWQCDKCDQAVDECDYRYILQLQIQDHTGTTWITVFQETGEEIMGVSAKELYAMKHEEQDEDRFIETIRNAIFTKYSFKLKVKEETYGEDQRVKSTVVKAEKIKFSPNTFILLLELHRMHEKKYPSSIPTNLEIPIPSSGLDPQLRTAGFKETGSPVLNYVRGVTGTGQMGHYGSQYGGSGGRINSGMPSASGNTATSVECYKCHQWGHWAIDCPRVSTVPLYGSESVAYGRIQSGGHPVGENIVVSGECFKCHQMGHWARDCPGK